MDDSTFVRALLEQSGIDPSDADVAQLAGAYPMVRAMADMLYGVEAARYESPALRFDPEPRFADWT